jgi:hypothetical protein
MRSRQAVHVLAALLLAALVLPNVARAGTFAIFANGACPCDGTLVPQEWNLFTVYYDAAGQEECTFLRAGFRIQGVPDDPALMRRFDPQIPMAGDPFGQGVILGDFWAAPGDTPVGFIWIYAAMPLAPHVWSVEAHQGISGTAAPVAAFEEAPSVWVEQIAVSLVVGQSMPCSGCPPYFLDCPFAVEPSAWSAVKRLYR